MHGAGDLDRVGDELAGGAEGRARVHPPGAVGPVDGPAGHQGHDDDHGEIDGDDARAQELQQHHQAAEIGGRAGEQEHQGGARTETLHHQRRRQRRGRGGAGVDRDADQQHCQHRDKPPE